VKISIDDRRIRVHGLPWLHQNAPDFFRLPKDAFDGLPEGVVRQARFPAGGRIRFTCESRHLSLDVDGVTGSVGHGIDVYIDGKFWRTINVAERGKTDGVIFDGLPKEKRVIEAYLPYRQEIRVDGINVDNDADVVAPPSHRLSLPIIFYGSSVAQGVGAHRSSMSYEAILGRMLDADFINFGFGGAGKAEPEVVELVAGETASCFVFDLGKSYGTQSYHVYQTMLSTVRDAHPVTPVVCMTPIFSARERYNPEYARLSEHTRNVVHRATEGLDVLVVDGLDLLGSEDADGLSGDGVHPSELGFYRIAEGLLPVVRKDWRKSRP
jgi:lysophospholipase L1-like esterase